LKIKWQALKKDTDPQFQKLYHHRLEANEWTWIHKWLQRVFTSDEM